MRADAKSASTLLRVPDRGEGSPGDVADGTLARRAAEGDEAAFRSLVQRHRGLIEAACASVVVSRTEREDAVQVALVDIWRGLAGFEHESSVTTWMYRVARNAAVRAVTRRKGRNEQATERVAESATSHDGWDESSATRDVVLSVLERLPQDQRDALLLHTQAGLPLKEIAQMKVAAEGTVKAWIHRARAEIAKELAAAGSA